MARITDLPRPVMRDIGRELVKRLQARMDAGPAEPGLDGFIPELSAVVGRLGTHVGGGDLADAGRRAAVARQELADCDVDTWLRHCESFIGIEARRVVGPYIVQVKAIHAAAFPEGLGIVDDYIPDENRACRTAISVLREPEHAAILSAIRFPTTWLSDWEAAIDASDAAFSDAEAARLSRRQHVGLGLDAEAEFAELGLRLRRYIDSRASRSDKARVAEGQALLAPLLDALKKLRTERKARATRRENAEAEVQAAPEGPSSAPATDPTPD